MAKVGFISYAVGNLSYLVWFCRKANSHKPGTRRTFAPVDAQPNNPLHGIKLAQMLEELLAHYGWQGLGTRIDIRCFNVDPSLKSSLTFLRRTPWARQQVEDLYLRLITSRKPRL